MYLAPRVRFSKCVSILVLVDVGLRPSSFSTDDDIALSFNPCFSGCWSSTGNPQVCWYQALAVSILVLVDVGLRLIWNCFII